VGDFFGGGFIFFVFFCLTESLQMPFHAVLMKEEKTAAWMLPGYSGQKT